MIIKSKSSNLSLASAIQKESETRPRNPILLILSHVKAVNSNLGHQMQLSWGIVNHLKVVNIQVNIQLEVQIKLKD